MIAFVVIGYMIACPFTAHADPELQSVTIDGPDSLSRVETGTYTFTFTFDENMEDKRAYFRERYQILSTRLVCTASTSAYNGNIITETRVFNFTGPSSAEPGIISAKWQGYVEASKTVNRKPVLTITAKNMSYPYNGAIQGPGDALYGPDPDEIADVVTVTGLQDGDVLTGIQIDGQGTEAGEYPLIPKSAQVNNGNVSVTNKYDITYVNGKLFITGYNPAPAPDPKDDDHKDRAHKLRHHFVQTS